MTQTLPTSRTRPSLAERFNAAIYDPFLARGERAGMARRRAGLLAGATGAVLEIGAGTGLNLAHYPAGLDRLVLTEPAAGMAARLRRRAARERPGAEIVEAGADALPFADGAFDTVVSTMVLCTVPDAEAAIGEIRRVLRPGGRLLFVEHVRAEDGSRLSRWQDRLAGPWAAFAEGCRCDRSTLTLLREHLTVATVDDDRWDGMPRIVAPLVVGHAVAS